MFEKTKKCVVTTAVNGDEAFQAVNRGLLSDPKVLFDLVILDLNMPVMSGFEASSKVNMAFN
jgi:CheY-like chemotaxis protein